jgi:hypothetical protein
MSTDESSIADEPRRDVGYVLNLAEFQFQLPKEVLPGVSLRKASLSETAFISEFLKSDYSMDIPHHESEFTFDERGGFGAGRLTEPAQWRYYVVDYPIWDSPLNMSERAQLIDLAAVVSDARLHLGVASEKEPRSTRATPTHRKHFVDCWPDYLDLLLQHHHSLQRVTEADIEDVQTVFQQLSGLDCETEFIRDAARLYDQSFSVSVRSRIRILALFAAIELLITHKPKSTDNSDGLTRQVKTKLSLVAKRFKVPLHPRLEFGELDDESAWEIIYNYRSLIAHGGRIDFKTAYSSKKKKYEGAAQLKSDKHMLLFLEDFTRRLLRYALQEPEFITDLKKC